ncbi:MAG TPA: EscU/YscU/HrcU family type III secretion system export apparatus switch protein [Sphingomonadaceae bacterium]|nr:EscU/YscU/HrcU family type III secretion system export apparatus switch protein [Sphingomonadaceae bacterium]
MSDGGGGEQNKSEEATPFKLKRAREKGQVARGMDLGFFGVLLALAAFLTVAGEGVAQTLALLMRRSLGAGIEGATDPQHATATMAAVYWPALQPILLLGGTVVAIALLFEVVQLRGLIFTTHPLKPDFSKINPAKGLKRLFSVRMLKEALKNVVKFAAYATVTFLVVKSVMTTPGFYGDGAAGLADAMRGVGTRLLMLFILLALFFAGIDQIMVRREYSKQMRMSRSELTRESKDREGEPRMRQKRKQLHAEFVQQSKDLGKLPGSDMLIVNPQHVAVALGYDAATMAAPTVTAKARNHNALAMKRQAFRLGIPIFENRPLARALYERGETGREIGANEYGGVADLYFKLHAARAATTDNAARAATSGNNDARQDAPQ